MFSLQAKTANHLTAGIVISTQGIVLAIIENKKNKAEIKHAQFYPCELSEQSDVLTQLAKKHHLTTIPCNLVLQPDEYQIVQVDEPEVPKQELTTALRWQIKDLINFHIDDVVIEHMNLPTENTSGKQQIQVIATRQSLIQTYVSQLHASQCNLAAIDISIMAARNIISQLNPEHETASVGLINLWDNYNRITVLVNDSIYINRTSNIGLNELSFVSDDPTSQTIIDSLALEIQRTFDYYDSHSRQAPIDQLLIMNNGQEINNLNGLLQQRLGIDCILVNIADFISVAEPTEELTNKCLMAIGGALRTEF